MAKIKPKLRLPYAKKYTGVKKYDTTGSLIVTKISYVEQLAPNEKMQNYLVTCLWQVFLCHENKIIFFPKLVSGGCFYVPEEKLQTFFSFETCL